MKKVLALMLALVLVLSLVACGGSSGEKSGGENQAAETTLDKNDVANYIGTWESNHIRYTFNKGGVGEFGLKTMASYSFTYEVKEEVVALKIHNSDMTLDAALELNDDGTELLLIQNPISFDNSSDEKNYKKVQ